MSKATEARESLMLAITAAIMGKGWSVSDGAVNEFVDALLAAVDERIEVAKGEVRREFRDHLRQELMIVNNGG